MRWRARAAGAHEAALWALAAMLVLGAVAVLFRHLGFIGITGMTLRTMSDTAQEAFARLQRFSTDWHANNFAGSTVRKITRGMWALDLLTDTILIALLPSIVVLLGTTALLAWHWPAMGLVVLRGRGSLCRRHRRAVAELRRAGGAARQ